jgi:hypothetical protein
MTEPVPFLASGEMRQTDREILEVILHVADGDEAEAERMWHAPSDMELIDIFVALQKRDLDPDRLKWPPMGLLWGRAIQEII